MLLFILKVTVYREQMQMKYNMKRTLNDDILETI